ncbi:MAG: hypothetical protein HKN43_07470 [Rhodothermales bacterium]|nr:hypothetical protein [Rhodothermales bacterium]
MTFIEHSIITERTARYYTSESHTEASDIWVVLHGYGQLARAFIEDFSPVANDSRRIVAPEGLSRFYIRAGQGAIGANWMTSEDRLNEIEDYISFLDNVTIEVRQQENQRVFVLGFSQGAATACRWFTHSTLRLDGLAVWGGGIPPDLDFKALSTRLQGRSLSVVCGRSDIYMSENRFRAELQTLEKHDVSHRPVTFDGGHQIEPDVLNDLLVHHEAKSAS